MTVPKSIQAQVVRKTDLKHKGKYHPVEQWESAFIERWTLERVDPEANMARVEIAPMKTEHCTGDLIRSLLAEGLERSMDRLSLWEIDQIRIRRMSLNHLAKELHLHEAEQTGLSENMVFWVLFKDGSRKPDHIIHGTKSARQFAKDIYRQVSGR